MLSAKLAEGKMKIVTAEGLEEAKTKNLAKILKNLGLESDKTLIVTGYKPEPNFEIASQNIQNLETCLPNVILEKKKRKLIFNENKKEKTLKT